MRISILCILAGEMLIGCGSELALVNQSQIETFTQRPNDEIDILFVVDDSGSMAEEQQSLADGFLSFIEQVEDANAKFHLGVISTSQESDDPKRGHLKGNPPFLTAEDDYVNGFRERVQVGTGGSDKEKGLEAAWLAVSPEALAGPNEGFLRDEANLLVVFVSDEEDCSDGGALDGQDADNCYLQDDILVPVGEIVDGLWDAKHNDRDKVSMGAIIAPNGDAANCEAAYPGFRYARTVELAGGMIGNVCLSDWSSMLYDLGLTASGVLDHFELNSAADPNTIEVAVDDFEVYEDNQDGWTYAAETWTVKFHGSAVPPRGSVISIEYTTLPGERGT